MGKNIKVKVKEGCRARLNAAFHQLFNEPKVRGIMVVVEGPHPQIPGCWACRMEGVAPVQHVHEKFLEVLS